LVGEFDGERYVPLGELPCPHVGPLYAEVTFNDVPDGRRLLMGWLQESPDSDRPWVGMQSIPRELSLAETPDGLCLVQRPAREILALRRQGQEICGGSELAGCAWEIVTPAAAGEFGLILDDGSMVPIPGPASSSCRILLDHRVVEVFADGGHWVGVHILPHGRRPVQLTWSGSMPVVLYPLAIPRAIPSQD
jgi:hypothetical protein